MPLTYAGVPLLADNPEGDVQRWLDQWLPLSDLRIAGWPPAIYNRGDIPLPNYPPPLQPRLNTWYRPVGASRWSFGLFLADASRKAAILSAVGAANNPQTLSLEFPETDDHRFRRGWQAYLLPPRAVGVDANDGEGLWLIPLVDERWYWQFLSAGDFAVGSATTWADMFNLLKVRLGMADLDASPVSADYGSPNVWVFNQHQHANAAVMLDAVAHSVGQRIVLEYRSTDGENYESNVYLSADSATSDFRRTLSLSRETAGALQAGSVSVEALNLRALRPERVEVVFRKWANGIVWDGEFYVKSITPADFGAAGTETTAGYVKTIRTTALADYGTGGGDPDNLSACDALALRIATDFYNHLKWVHDSNFVGVGHWFESGHDDYVEFSVAQRIGWEEEAGGLYGSRTRVHSLPYNAACESLLHQLPETHEYGDHVLGFMLGDLAAFGTATMAIYEGSPPADTGRTLVVTEQYGATLSTSDPVRAFKIGKLWIADTGGGGGDGGSAIRIGKTDAAIKQGESGTVSLYTGATPDALTDTTDNVTAYSRFNRVEAGRWVALVTKPWGEELIEIERKGPFLAKATAFGIAGDVVEFQVLRPDGAKGAEANDSGVTFDAYVRKGLVFENGEYLIEDVCPGSDADFEVVNPSMRFRGQTNAAIAAGAVDGSVSIYEWTGSGWNDTGEDLENVVNLLDEEIEISKVVLCEALMPPGDRFGIYQAHWSCPEV